MTAPAPLQPADVNLQGMEYFPRYIERLRRSRAMQLAISEPAAGFSMFCLWDESWFALPAGSLEDDELLLAAGAKCSRAEWKQRKPIALYGWVLCSDGRWYHPVICELAWSCWVERLKHRHKNACDRMAKANKRAIEDARDVANRIQRHANLKTIPSFEAWVSNDYPATAAKLFAAATPSVPPSAAPTAPAAASSAAVPDYAAEKGASVAEKPPPFSATHPPVLSETGLKREDKGKIIPPTPLGGEAARPEEVGGEWQREADFAAYFEAVGQPEAPLRSTWTAWLEVVRDLPERRILLAQVAAWRKHYAQLNAGRRHQTRPLGPARLLREGTLGNFTAQAEALLSNDAAVTMIEMREDERTDAARAAWGDLYQPVMAVAGGVPQFTAWFANAWPIWEGAKLVVATPRTFIVNWVRQHYAHAMAKALGCEVEVRQVFEQRGAE